MDQSIQINNFKKITNLGQSLVELIIAMGVASVILPAVITGIVSGREGKADQDLRLRATAYLKEAEEATRVVREKGWSSFAVNGTYHPVVSGNTWSFASGSEIVTDFTRSIVISDTSPVDASAKKVTFSVEWGQDDTEKVTSEAYFTRYLENDTYLETTQAQFDLGIKTNTVTTNSSGGEVQLGSGGKSDWCEPSISSIAPIDLPKNGVANAVSAIEGKVFAGTGENASGVSFAKVAITNTDPPSGSISATFDGYKTNGVYGDDNYAYLATDSNTKEVVIVNLNSIVSEKYQEASSFNAPGNGNGSSIFVTSNYGFMASTNGNKLYNFNKPGQSLSLDTDGLALSDIGNKIYVSGNYAYVATNSTTNQLDIVDISSPTNLVKIKSFGVNGLSGKDVYVNHAGTRAYLVTSHSSTQSEFFIIDISDKLNPSVIGSYDTQGMSPKGIVIVPGNKAIVVGTGGTQQYQVIDIADEVLPVHCTSNGRSGGLTVSTGINGVSSVLEADGDAYSYIITGDSSSELKIIEGGPGGNYSNSGVFESKVFDAGHEVSFNRYVKTEITPFGTSTAYQFAVTNPVSGSCNNATYDFISSSGPILLTGQCIKYKVLFSSNDPGTSPVFKDVTINYSP